MSIEENKGIMRRWVEELNQGNLAVLDELSASNYVRHVAGMEDVRGPEANKQGLAALFTAFPDHHVTVEDMVGEGDKVVTRITWTGTQRGEFQGVAPTGKQVTMKAMTMCRIEGGKIVEEWEVWEGWA